MSLERHAAPDVWLTWLTAVHNSSTVLFVVVRLFQLMSFGLLLDLPVLLANRQVVPQLPPPPPAFLAVSCRSAISLLPPSLSPGVSQFLRPWLQRCSFLRGMRLILKAVIIPYLQCYEMDMLCHVARCSCRPSTDPKKRSAALPARRRPCRRSPSCAP